MMKLFFAMALISSLLVASCGGSEPPPSLNEKQVLEILYGHLMTQADDLKGFSADLEKFKIESSFFQSTSVAARESTQAFNAALEENRDLPNLRTIGVETIHQSGFSTRIMTGGLNRLAAYAGDGVWKITLLGEWWVDEATESVQAWVFSPSDDIRNPKSDRERVGDLLVDSEYIDHVSPYAIELGEIIIEVLDRIALQSSGTIEGSAEVLATNLERVREQRRNYSAVEVPAQYRELHNLVLALFHATEKSSKLASDAFTRVLAPAESRTELLARFQDDRFLTVESTVEAKESLEIAMTELTRLVDQLEEKLKALGAVK